MGPSARCSAGGKLMEAVGQVEMMMSVMDTLRNVMLERFWKILCASADLKL